MTITIANNFGNCQRKIFTDVLTDIVVGAPVDVHGLIVRKHQGCPLDREVAFADAEDEKK